MVKVKPLMFYDKLNKLCIHSFPSLKLHTHNGCINNGSIHDSEYEMKILSELKYWFTSSC